MKLSDDKISQLTHVVFKGLMDRELIFVHAEESEARKAVKRAIVGELKLGEQIEDAVKGKITSLSRGVVEGSPEWDVLYEKYFKEESRKRGRAA